MCSISGCLIFSKLRTDEELAEIERKMRSIIVKAEERGRDSYGIVSIGLEGTYREYKSVSKPSDTIDYVPRLVYKDTTIVLNNNRAEPTTEYVSRKSAEDIQPFIDYGYVVAHNGVIANDKELERELHLERGSRIDTAVIPPLLSKLWDGTPSGLRNILVDTLKGSYALALVDLKHPTQLYLAVNYKPLYLRYDRKLDVLFFTSLDTYFEDTPIWDANPVKQLKPYTLLCVDNYKKYRQVSLWKKEDTARKKVLAVCSSGLDSTVAAHYLQTQGYDVTLLHFRYEHRAQAKEHESVSKLSQALNMPLIVVDTGFFKTHSHESPLLDTSKKVSTKGEGESGAEFAHEWVSARNLVFLSLATSIAEDKGFDYVTIGVNLEEAGAFSDNEMMFIKKFNELLPYATNLQNRVEVLMPVGHLMKHEIVRLGTQIGTPLELTWSCYEGGEKHCGKCGPCYMRRKAFEMNGIKDPVMYEDDGRVN
jgi:7-cyano-7-deazaguanine synthase